MKKPDTVAAILVVVGALNWGLVAIAHFDLVAAIFDPVGLMGQRYARYPIHRFVFAGMPAGIVRAMRRQGSAPNAVAGVPIVVNRS
jgi:hypothetical protein